MRLIRGTLSKSWGLRLVNRNNNRFITAGHIRLLLVLMGFSLVWIMFVKLIVLPVIESAYRGESWSFLNRMILGQAESLVSHYLQKWDKVTITVLLSGLGFSLIALVISSPAFIRNRPGSLPMVNDAGVISWSDRLAYTRRNSARSALPFLVARNSRGL